MLKKVLKFLKKFFLGLGVFILLITVVLLFVKTEPLQDLVQADVIPTLEFDSSATSIQFDSLAAIYGNNKVLLPGFELQTLLALSFFPDLKDNYINFSYEPAFVPMASRPDPSSLFASKKNWIYNVIISSKSTESMEAILIHHLPFNGQVGILVHELCHTVHYKKFSALQMMKFGVQYLINSSYRAKHERSTDALAVYRGAGAMLFEYAYYIRYETGSQEAVEATSNYMNKFYLSDQEIADLMTTLEIYDGLNFKRK